MMLAANEPARAPLPEGPSTAGRWEAPVLATALSLVSVGGEAMPVVRHFDVGRLLLDDGLTLLGSAVGVAALLYASFALGPKGGGLLLPLTEWKLFGVLLIGGLVGAVGGLTGAEAIGDHLHHPWALLAGAGGFVVTSGLIIALIDGVFHLPFWADVILIPLALTAATLGSYALAVPRQP